MLMSSCVQVGPFGEEMKGKKGKVARYHIKLMQDENEKVEGTEEYPPSCTRQQAARVHGGGRERNLGSVFNFCLLHSVRAEKKDISFCFSFHAFPQSSSFNMERSAPLDGCLIFVVRDNYFPTFSPLAIFKEKYVSGYFC